MCRAARVFVVALGWGLLAASAGPAFALQIWLSDVGLPGQGVAVGNLEREFVEPVNDQELFIWGRPDAEKTLGAIDLRIVSSNREVLDFTGATFHSPLIGQAEFSSKDMRRFEFALNPVMSDPSSVVERIGGFSVTNEASIGAGIGPGSTATDPLYDTEADAWLLGTVTYDVIGSGSTNLFLQIGNNGLLYKGGRSSEVDIVFGGGADQALNGKTDRMVNSVTPDGSITLNGDYLRPEGWYEAPVVDRPAPDPVTVLPPDNGTHPGDAGNVAEESIDEAVGDDPTEPDREVADVPVDGVDRSGSDVPIFTTGEAAELIRVLPIVDRPFILSPDQPTDLWKEVLLPGAAKPVWHDLAFDGQFDGVGRQLLFNRAEIVPLEVETQGLAIPEPSTLLLLVVGLFSIAGTVRRSGCDELASDPI